MWLMQLTVWKNEPSSYYFEIGKDKAINTMWTNISQGN